MEELTNWIVPIQLQSSDQDKRRQGDEDSQLLVPTTSTWVSCLNWQPFQQFSLNSNGLVKRKTKLTGGKLLLLNWQS
jgi:hypothetical protein